MSTHPIAFSRRDLLRLSAAGALASCQWLPALAQAGEAEGRKQKSCILLYMGGGASHLDTFDLKPGNGEFKPIDTAVPGIQISEHLPRLAASMQDIAILRGMHTTEGSHARARYLIHTGYREGAGGVVHPTLGSIASAASGDSEAELPNFITIKTGGKDKSRLGPGYLGSAHAPLKIVDPESGVQNVKPAGTLQAFDRRAGLLDDMEQSFSDRKQALAVQAHRDVYHSAARLMHSARLRAFDLTQEPASVRQSYGAGAFAEGCLLARRLIEVGVPFVEVDMEGWDTHQDNFPRVKELSVRLDNGLSALLADLRSRGLLESTLVVWMGDFGRTPQVKRGGRGHYPLAWTTLLCGGRLKTGQIIGRTNKQGSQVEDRPIAINDFLATICAALGIDYTKEVITRLGRPMRLVEKGEKPITELVS